MTSCLAFINHHPRQSGATWTDVKDVTGLLGKRRQLAPDVVVDALLKRLAIAIGESNPLMSAEAGVHSSAPEVFVGQVLKSGQQTFGRLVHDGSFICGALL